MKRLAKIVALIMVAILSVQMLKLTAHAAPAPAVSRIQAESCWVGSDGFVYVRVLVTGYGRSENATYDGTNCQLVNYEPVRQPVVSQFRYTYRCKRAETGSHVFAFRITSQNSPWNTVSGSWGITVR